ncbi:MAG: hypothetical protein ISR65_08185 [Bacteriovoracaceae bacterium]|nr:hypothetical protein [Bacteriovoracaceae bacterium]
MAYSQAEGVEDKTYYGHERSLIDWKRINPEHWVDLVRWKKQRKFRDKTSSWALLNRDRLLREHVGRILECFGKCKIYSGQHYSLGQYRSLIRERDTVITDENSYAWIYLMDGTMVRLSPRSNVAFLEINFGSRETFLYVRITSGDVVWLSRQNHTLTPSDKKETDALFLPLSLDAANYKLPKVDIDVDNMGQSIWSMDAKTRNQNKYHVLNKFIAQNNYLIGDRVTRSLLVTPNGTLYGTNLYMHLVVLPFGNLYYRSRPPGIYNLQHLVPGHSQYNQQSISFYKRGQGADGNTEIIDNSWHKVLTTGDSTVELSENENKRLAHSEFLTRRIPTILTGRELMLKRYSLGMLKIGVTTQSLAELAGYRMWQIDHINKFNEITQRTNFLLTHTDNVETQRLAISLKLREKWGQKDDLWQTYSYGPWAYKRAVSAYALATDPLQPFNSDRERFNSHQIKAWKILNDLK